MKKFASLILALAMMFTLCTGVSAAEINQSGDGSKLVTIDFVDGAHDVTIYNVTITWNGNLTFTYTRGDEQVWNPATHKYSETTEGGWSAAQTFTVNNHSNADVKASASFDEGTPTVITKTEGNATVTISCDMTADLNGQITLLNAATYAPENIAGVATKTLATYTVTPSGSAEADNDSFGTIYVKLSPAT